MSSKAPPASVALRSRLGAYIMHSRNDPRETTANGRAAFLAKFEAEVDPDRVLPLAERARRATAARKAHFTRLAMASAKVRAAKPPKKSSAPLADRAELETLAGEASCVRSNLPS